MVDLATLTAAVEAGDRKSAVAITQSAIDEGIAPQQILDAMTKAMDAVGGKFSRNELYVPEMLISARAMKESTALLEPLLVKAGIRPAHTAVVGTIKGDLHDIGKNLVAMMWKGAGIAIVDLGTNVSPEQFVSAAKEHAASLVGGSGPPHHHHGGDEGRGVRGQGRRPPTKVLVGGAPLTPEFAASIGADGYAPDAASAVEVARGILA